MKMDFKFLFKNFKEGLFPKKCIICYEYGGWICEKHNKIPDIRIKRPMDEKYLTSNFSATDYKNKTIKKIIHYFKFKGFKDIGEVCADIIIEKIGVDFFKNKALIPIPLYWTRKFSRGFNQTEIIAFYLQKKLKTNYHINIKVYKNLRKIKNTHQQALLDKEERANNLKNVFKCKWGKKETPENIILIDDVFTTGTTLNMAAKELKKSGVKNIYGLTFARND